MWVGVGAVIAAIGVFAGVLEDLLFILYFETFPEHWHGGTPDQAPSECPASTRCGPLHGRRTPLVCAGGLESIGLSRTVCDAWL